MNDQVHEWLPDSALAGGPLAAAINAVAAEWSARWFPCVAARSAALELSRGAGALDAAWRRTGDVLAVRMSRPLSLRLAERALGVRLEGLSPNDNDQRVIMALARRIVDDLGRALADGCGDNPGEPLERGRIVRFNLEDGRDRLAEVLMAADAGVRLAKARLARPARRDPPPGSLAASIGEVRARVEVGVGGAQMTLSELRGLARGDVVVLDRPLKAGVSLSAPASGLQVARGVLAQADGRMALTLQP